MRSSFEIWSERLNEFVRELNIQNRVYEVEWQLLEKRFFFYTAPKVLNEDHDQLMLLELKLGKVLNVR